MICYLLSLFFNTGILIVLIEMNGVIMNVETSCFLLKMILVHCLNVCNNALFAMEWRDFVFFFNRISYPCRYNDMVPRFGINPTELCLIFTLFTAIDFSPGINHFCRKISCTVMLLLCTSLMHSLQTVLASMMEVCDLLHGQTAAKEFCLMGINNSMIKNFRVLFYQMA